MCRRASWISSVLLLRKSLPVWIDACGTESCPRVREKTTAFIAGIISGQMGWYGLAAESPECACGEIDCPNLAQVESHAPSCTIQRKTLLAASAGMRATMA